MRKSNNHQQRSRIQEMQSDESQMPEVLDVAQAASFLNISERTVRIRLREGTLPGWKIGGLWRLSKAAIDGNLVSANAKPRGAAKRA